MREALFKGIESKECIETCHQPGGFKQPMLATLTKIRFSHPNWIFEEKLDGIRCIVVKKGKKVTLYSRNHNILNETYPELVKPFETQRTKNFVIDGEIVAFDGKVTSFSKLQERINLHDPSKVMKRIKVYFYAFDILCVGHYDVRKLPLIERKKVLKRVLTFKDGIRFTEHRTEFGEKYFKEAEAKNWEGLIAKRADSTYVNKRSKDWLKFKTIKGDRFLIGGFTAPKGSRLGFGALLLAYPGAGKLKYAGKVGTGYNDALLQSLSKRLYKLKRSASPFEDKKVPSKDVTWVDPKIEVQIGYTERTKEGRLRHPRFIKILCGV